MCHTDEKGSGGATGIPGPYPITYFDAINKRWSKKYAVLQALCFGVQKFLLENPEIAAKVEITQFDIKTYINPNK